MKIIVVGAGVAGLTIANLLSEKGYEIIVLEKENQVGGLARSVIYDKNIFDFGPHRFHSDDSEVINFINKVLEKNILSIKRNSKVWLFSHYHNWPLDYQTIFKLPITIMIKSFFDLFHKEEFKDETFKNYVVSKYGNTLYKYFFAPYTNKFLNYLPEELHSDWGKIGIDRAVISNEVKMNNLFDILKCVLLPKKAEMNFLYPAVGGIQTFSDILVRNIENVKINEWPEKLKIENDKIVEIKTNLGEYKNIDKVIWTAPITDLMEILGIKNIDLEFLSSVFYNIILKNKTVADYQWCYFGTADIFFNRISIPYKFSIDNLNKKNKHTLCVELASKKNAVLYKDSSNFNSLLIEDLKKVRAISSINDIENIYLKKVENTYPIYKTNYKTELKKAKTELNKLDNLTLLGRSGEFWYNNMDHSIKKAITLFKEKF